MSLSLCTRSGDSRIGVVRGIGVGSVGSLDAVRKAIDRVKRLRTSV